MSFVSEDGSFGFGGMSDDMMMGAMLPAIRELGEAAFRNPDTYESIFDSMAFRHPEFNQDASEPSHSVCAILAMKKYNLSLEDAVDKIFEGKIVEWTFAEFLKSNKLDLDKVFMGATPIVIGIGEKVEVGDVSNIPLEVKLEMMASLAFEDKTNYYFIQAQKKMTDALTSLRSNVNFHFIVQHAVMMQWRYKVSFDECVKLALEGKAIDECFKRFLEEAGTELASEFMGDSPSAFKN